MWGVFGQAGQGGRDIVADGEEGVELDDFEDFEDEAVAGGVGDFFVDAADSQRGVFSVHLFLEGDEQADGGR